MDLLAVGTALEFALSTTSVTNWDFWGPAPSLEDPAVGAYWPNRVIRLPSYSEYEYFVGAAFYASSHTELAGTIAPFVDSIGQLFGPTSPCPPGFGGLGLSAELGDVLIGAPNSSAYSATAPTAGGVWASVSFTLTLRG